jgi:hypothetical protein
MAWPACAEEARVWSALCWLLAPCCCLVGATAGLLFVLWRPLQVLVWVYAGGTQAGLSPLLQVASRLQQLPMLAAVPTTIPRTACACRRTAVPAAALSCMIVRLLRRQLLQVPGACWPHGLCRTAKLSVCTTAATSALRTVLLTKLCCCCRWPGGVAGVPLSSHSGTLPQVQVQYTL